MAQFNTIQFSYLKTKNRIDSEYYKYSDVIEEEFLKKVCKGIRLKDVSTELSERFDKNTVPQFQYNDIGNTDQHYGFVKPNIVKSSNAPGRAVFINKKDDVLISTVRPNRNANAILDKSEHVQVGSNGFVNLRASIVNPNYLYLYSKTKYFINSLVRATTSSMYPAVSNRDVLNTFFYKTDENLEEHLGSLVEKARQLRKNSTEYYNKATKLLNEKIDFTYILDSEQNNKYQSYISSLIAGRRYDAEFYTPAVVKVIKKIQSLDHTQIGSNFFIKNGYPWNSNKFQSNPNGEPVIRIRDIKPIYIDTSKLTTLEFKYATKINFQKTKPKDIVVGMDGLKYFYASILEDEVLVNQRVCHLSPKPNSKISSEYLTFIINSKLGQAQLLRSMTIATTVGHITNSDISKFYVPIISETFHNKITNLIRMSINAERESKQLLEQAKQEVEQLIENAAQN